MAVRCGKSESDQVCERKPGVNNSGEKFNIYMWESKGKELSQCENLVWKKKKRDCPGV